MTLAREREIVRQNERERKAVLTIGSSWSANGIVFQACIRPGWAEFKAHIFLEIRYYTGSMFLFPAFINSSIQRVILSDNEKETRINDRLVSQIPSCTFFFKRKEVERRSPRGHSSCHRCRWLARMHVLLPRQSGWWNLKHLPNTRSVPSYHSLIKHHTNKHLVHFFNFYFYFF